MYTAAHYYENVVEGLGGNPKDVRPQPYGQIITGIAFNHEELYPILNMAVGGIWNNLPTTSGGTGRVDEGNQFPSRQDIDNWGNPALEIDWIRIYKPQ